MSAPPISSILQGGYHHPVLRTLQAERTLTKEMLMYPLFITDDADAETEIQALPGQKRFGVNKLIPFLEPLISKGLRSVILFGVPLSESTHPKDACGTHADSQTTPVVVAIKLLRQAFPKLLIAADVCLCEYTSHGHCGILSADGLIDNTLSVERIAEVALNYAKAGADIVAPSDMMDGRIRAIKLALIKEGFSNKCSLMAYSAKFASSLYGPFREAAGSVPDFGDRKCYQLPVNARGLAKRAIIRDANEGADFIMIKPTLPYLDILAEARDLVPNHPLACYQVSGEFAMIHAGANAGVYDLKDMVMETMDSFLRAGATLILTYFTPELLDWVEERS